MSALMFSRLKQNWIARQQRWMDRRNPARDEVTLNMRNIFIIPSRNGMLYVLACSLIFIAAINYAVSLAFGLTFMMVSIFILAILHGFNNLSQLTLSSQPAPPVFCGEEACFKVLISRLPHRRHEGLLLNFPGSASSHADLVEHDLESVDVFTRTHKRGRMQAPRLSVTTYYPLGLCRAWSVVDLNMQVLVYPKPIPHVLDQFNHGATGNDDDNHSLICGHRHAGELLAGDW